MDLARERVRLCLGSLRYLAYSEFAFVSKSLWRHPLRSCLLSRASCLPLSTKRKLQEKLNHNIGYSFSKISSKSDAVMPTLSSPLEAPL